METVQTKRLHKKTKETRFRTIWTVRTSFLYASWYIHAHTTKQQRIFCSANQDAYKWDRTWNKEEDFHWRMGKSLRGYCRLVSPACVLRALSHEQCKPTTQSEYRMLKCPKNNLLATNRIMYCFGFRVCRSTLRHDDWHVLRICKCPVHPFLDLESNNQSFSRRRINRQLTEPWTLIRRKYNFM